MAPQFSNIKVSWIVCIQFISAYMGRIHKILWQSFFYRAIVPHSCP